MRLTGVRDASSHASTATMSAARSALLLPNQPGTQACLGHPAAHRHSPSPWLQPGPRAAPQVPGSRTAPPGPSSSAQTQGLDYPITSHSDSCHKHTLCSWFPHIPRNAQAQSPHLLHPAGLGKLGSMKHPGLIKTHQLSLRCTRRRTPCQCQKCLPGQQGHRQPVEMGLVQQSDNCLCGRVGCGSRQQEFGTAQHCHMY